MNRSGIAVARRDVINALGVRYTHSGKPGDPVRERLGALGVPDDPLYPVRTFATDEEALVYAVNLTRETARKDLVEASDELDSFRGSWRLWLARNWKLARLRYGSDLAAAAILEARITAARKAINGGSFVSVERLDETICLPATLTAGTPVFAVDTSGFPGKPVTLEQTVINEVHFLETPGHPLFHAVARYKIAGRQGYYAYDHVDTDEVALSSPSSTGPTMYLDAEVAQREVTTFVEGVKDMLELSARPTMLLTGPAAPVTEVIALQAPERVEGTVENGDIEVPYEIDAEPAVIELSETVTHAIEPDHDEDDLLAELQATPAIEPSEVVEAASEPPSGHDAEVRGNDRAEPGTSEGVPADAAVLLLPDHRTERQAPEPQAGPKASGILQFFKRIGAGPQIDATEVEPDVPIEVGDGPGEFSRFAENGIKIRRWDNASGQESLARIALESLG